MRNILIDLSAKNYPKNVRCGFKGEHKQTKITVVIPDELIPVIPNQYTYKFAFGTPRDEKIIYGANSVNNNEVGCILQQDVLMSECVSMQVEAHLVKNAETELIAKTPVVTLLIGDSVEGKVVNHTDISPESNLYDKIMDSIATLESGKQDKADDELNTTNKTVVLSINELNENKANIIHTHAQGDIVGLKDDFNTINDTVADLISDIDSIKTSVSGVYKYKGALEDISLLPNGDKVLHAIGNQAEYVEFKLLNGMIPEGATAIKVIAKSASNNNFEIGFYNEDYSKTISKPITLNEEYAEKEIDIQDVDINLFTKYRIYFLDDGASEFFLDKAYFVDSSTGKTVGVVQNFDYYKINSNGGAFDVKCDLAKVELKGTKVDVEIGSVYNVINTDDNYAWDGTDWDRLSGLIDLSLYQTKGDYRLQTRTKNIVGAINELNTTIGDVSTILDNINGEVV